LQVARAAVLFWPFYMTPYLMLRLSMEQLLSTEQEQQRQRQKGQQQQQQEKQQAVAAGADEWWACTDTASGL